MRRNRWLEAGAGLSAAAALLHLAIIAGGPGWYRYFGAGEGMAREAERGSPTPALYAVGIAGVLFAWTAYAWAGAGRMRRLPLMRPALLAISGVYLLRGLLPPVSLLIGGKPDALGRSDAFWWWSSLIVLAYGIVYAVGTWRAWPELGRRRPA